MSIEDFNFNVTYNFYENTIYIKPLNNKFRNVFVNILDQNRKSIYTENITSEKGLTYWFKLSIPFTNFDKISVEISCMDELIISESIKIKTSKGEIIKPIVAKFAKVGLGDQIWISPTIRKLYEIYGRKVILASDSNLDSWQSYLDSKYKEFFKNNRYVNYFISYDDIDDKDKYEIFELFPDNLNKTIWLDNKRFASFSCNLLLKDSELEINFIPDEYIPINLPEKYVCINPYVSGPERTWSKEEWQKLVDLLNDKGIPVVSIGEKNYHKLDIKLGLDLTDKDLNLSQTWYVINKSCLFVTFSCAIYILAGTTDTHILLLGWCIDEHLHKPSRNPEKFTCVRGDCDIYCYSDPLYKLEQNATITKEIKNNCYLNLNFKCKPAPEKSFEKIKEILFKNDIERFNSSENIFNEEELTICVYTMCMNEEEFLPFFLDYYTNYVGAKKIVIYDGGSTDKSHDIINSYPNTVLIKEKDEFTDSKRDLRIWNEEWKKDRYDYDWMIVCTLDEFIYHIDLKNKLIEYKKNSITIPLVEGYNMISLIHPTFKKGYYLHHQIKKGIKDSHFFNKNIIFNPREIDINYEIGCHRCNPTGNVQFSKNFELNLLHYKRISRDFLIRDSIKKNQRRSKWMIESGAGYHYETHSQITEKEYDEIYNQSIQVIKSIEFDNVNLEINDIQEIKIIQFNELENFMKIENDISFIGNEKIIKIKNTNSNGKYKFVIPYLENKGYKKYVEKNDGIFIIKKQPLIYVYSYNYLINEWESILIEQLNKLKKSGLYSKSDIIFMDAFGENDQWNRFIEIIKNYDTDKKIITERFSENFYEYHTLQKIWNTCQKTEEEIYILYFHLKGVWSSKNLQINTNDENDPTAPIRNPNAIEKWRDCLEYFNIERWYDCVDKLEKGYDTTGALYNYNESSPLYTGNFWWANSNHIKKLETPVYVKENEPYSDNLWIRIKCEFWINSVRNNFYNLYSPKDLSVYYYEINSEDYRDDIKPLFSILTPTYKRYEDLPKAINCVLNQTYENWEMLICSDGKDDKVEKIIRSYNDPKIKYFYTEKTNDHGATQRNYLTEVCNGKYIIYFDDDNIIYSNMLEILSKNFDEKTSMIIFKIDYDGLDHRLPTENKIILGKIDTLNFCVEKRFAKNAKWQNYIEHDYEVIKICESDILKNKKEIKFIPDVLGRHTDKLTKYKKIVQIGANKGYDDLTKMVNDNDFLLLVEPLEEFNNSLKSCYNKVSKLHIENVAIVNNDIKETTFYLHENSSTLWESSLLKSHILKHFSNENRIIEKKVKCKNINELLNFYALKDIDILFIDAEGVDDAIIKSIDFSKFNIKKIYYENYHIDVNDIENFLTSRGYNIYNRGVFEGTNSAEKNDSKIVYLITSHPSYKISEDITKKSVNNLKKLGETVILSSHCPVSIDLQKSVDYVIYDKNNPLIRHDFFTQSWFTTNEYYALLNITKNDNNFNHALGVFLNYYNSLLLAKSLGFTIAVCTNFDLIFSEKDKKIIDSKIEEMQKLNKKAFFMNTPEREGIHYKTIFFITNIDFFLNTFKYLVDEEVYMDEMKKVNSNTNCLENFFYHTLKTKTEELLLQEINENDLFPTSQINLFSLIEYATILPVENEPDNFVVWFSSANSLDNRNFFITIKKNKNIIFTGSDIISKQFIYWKKIKFEFGDDFEINFKVTSGDEIVKNKTILVNNDIFKEINSYGKFIDKNKTKI